MNLVGEGALVTGVLPDVFPTIEVEDLQTDGWGVAGWRPAMGGSDITGAVGENPIIQILNPNGSGQIAVIEWAMFGTNTTGTIGFNIHDAVLTTAEVSMRWRDRRFPTLQFPVVQIREVSQVGVPIVAPMNVRLAANVPLIFEPPKGFMVLAPGTGFALQHVTTASRLTAQFFWRERPADPAELNI